MDAKLFISVILDVRYHPVLSSVKFKVNDLTIVPLMCFRFMFLQKEIKTIENIFPVMKQ